MKFMYEGKEFEYRGEYRSPRQGEHVLDVRGGVCIVECGYGYGTRAIVHPVPVLHQFGGIEFRETGEVVCGTLRSGQVGILDTGNVVIAAKDIDNPSNIWVILESVRIL